MNSGIAMNSKTINCQINGANHQLSVSPAMPLSDVLRAQGFLSIKQGCCVGECGACTVRVDGVAIDSCLYLAVWAQGKTIRTVEGEYVNGQPSRLQQVFANSGAVQCGFCTPGFIMAASALLAKPRSQPMTVLQIRQGLAGNLCRCTGYQMIVDAIQECDCEA